MSDSKAMLLIGLVVGFGLSTIFDVLDVRMWRARAKARGYPDPPVVCECVTADEIESAAEVGCARATWKLSRSLDWMLWEPK